MAGLLGAPGNPAAADPVDRESAQVQSVVTLYAQSSFATVPLNRDVHALLDPLIQQKGEAGRCARHPPSPTSASRRRRFSRFWGPRRVHSVFRRRPTWTALRKAGVASEIIRIPGGTHGTGNWHTLPGVPDWERQMIQWLNTVLHHQGPIGAGIRQRG